MPAGLAGAGRRGGVRSARWGADLGRRGGWSGAGHRGACPDRQGRWRACRDAGRVRRATGPDRRAAHQDRWGARPDRWGARQDRSRASRGARQGRLGACRDRLGARQDRLRASQVHRGARQDRRDAHQDLRGAHRDRLRASRVPQGARQDRRGACRDRLRAGQGHRGACSGRSRAGRGACLDRSRARQDRRGGWPGRSPAGQDACPERRGQGRCVRWRLGEGRPVRTRQDRAGQGRSGWAFRGPVHLEADRRSGPGSPAAWCAEPVRRGWGRGGERTFLDQRRRVDGCGRRPSALRRAGQAHGPDQLRQGCSPAHVPGRRPSARSRVGHPQGCALDRQPPACPQVGCRRAHGFAHLPVAADHQQVHDPDLRPPSHPRVGRRVHAPGRQRQAHHRQVHVLRHQPQTPHQLAHDPGQPRAHHQRVHVPGQWQAHHQQAHALRHQPRAHRQQVHAPGRRQAHHRPASCRAGRRGPRSGRPPGSAGAAVCRLPQAVWHRWRQSRSTRS